MSHLLSPAEEIENVLARSATGFDRTIRAMAAAATLGDQVAMESAIAVGAEVFGRTLGYADLLGRRRMELLANYADAKTPRAQRLETVSAATAQHFAAVPSGGVLPRVEFTEVVSDIESRMPTVVRGWRNVAALYAEVHAFALSRSMSQTVTRHVQDVVARAVAGGDAAPIDPVGEIAEIGKWSRGYAETVYRTNAQTAYTAGVWARASDPDVLAVIPGFEFFSAHLATSRPNHEACAGMIAPTSSRLWDRYSPPLGYNCLCSITEITVYEAERLLEMEDDGDEPGDEWYRLY